MSDKVRTRRLGYQDGDNLRVGDRLYYSAGLNEHHCEAYVTVNRVGGTGVLVKVNQITTQGSASDIKENEEIVAAFSELEIAVTVR